MMIEKCISEKFECEKHFGCGLSHLCMASSLSDVFSFEVSSGTFFESQIFREFCY